MSKIIDKLAMLFLVVFMIYLLWCNVFDQKKIINLKEQVESLELSVTTLQRFTIQQDQLIMNNMLTLYRAIDAPVKDISLIELAIEEKQKLWSVIK